MGCSEDSEVAVGAEVVSEGVGNGEAAGANLSEGGANLSELVHVLGDGAHRGRGSSSVVEEARKGQRQNGGLPVGPRFDDYNDTGARYAQFTHFTSTKVQILTQKALRCAAIGSRSNKRRVSCSRLCGLKRRNLQMHSSQRLNAVVESGKRERLGWRRV